MYYTIVCVAGVGCELTCPATSTEELNNAVHQNVRMVIYSVIRCGRIEEKKLREVFARSSGGLI